MSSSTSTSLWWTPPRGVCLRSPHCADCIFTSLAFAIRYAVAAGEIQRMSGDPEQELLDCFHCLDASGRLELLWQARSLVRRSAGGRPRPASETVVKALRRLVRTYPMLDRLKVMPSAAELLEQNLRRGRSAPQVIDELEELFQRHYLRRVE